MQIGTTKLTTRYYETDQMGIIHHSNYYRYFEVARTDYLKTIIGMTYKDVENMGVRMPVTETHCKYKTSALYDDELTITTTVRELTVVRITFDYVMTREKDGVVIAEGATVHALTNGENKPINLKKYRAELYQQLFHAANSEA
ncbi:MAG: 4-hydroxybenzoyl-CoA thioesterase [Clostridia bacterium]|jgi:acyl-CoA thioester hydrolase|nr:4-hydroxybenzoyl-CoA thioesterase [Clostridia bacterium]